MRQAFDQHSHSDWMPPLLLFLRAIIPPPRTAPRPVLHPLISASPKRNQATVGYLAKACDLAELGGNVT